MLTTILLVVLFVLLSIQDIMTTHKAMKEGLYEYNLILRTIYKYFGTKGHILFKGITTIGFIIAVPLLSVEAIVIINIVFALVVINNLWVIQHAGN